MLLTLNNIRKIIFREMIGTKLKWSSKNYLFCKHKLIEISLAPWKWFCWWRCRTCLFLGCSCSVANKSSGCGTAKWCSDCCIHCDYVASLVISELTEQFPPYIMISQPWNRNNGPDAAAYTRRKRCHALC